jgi:hypothetical protein
LDNSFDPGTGPNVIVNTLAMQPDGKILLDGNFTSYTHGGFLPELERNFFEN